MYNNYHWYEMVAYEKITEARRAASRDRLALTAESGRAAGSPVSGLLCSLASAFGRGRPPLETAIPAGRAR